LNPVRAAMVDEPAYYRWTSYRANALGQTDCSSAQHPMFAPPDALSDALAACTVNVGLIEH